MADRINLVKSRNLNKNAVSPTKVIKIEKTYNHEKVFLDELANAREKIYAEVDKEFNNFAQEKLKAFQTSNIFPSIANDVKGMIKIDEGISIFLNGDKVLKESVKKNIFAPESTNKPDFLPFNNEDFPYKTLTRHPTTPLPKKTVKFNNTDKTEIVRPFIEKENEVIEREVEMIPSFKLNQKIKRIPKNSDNDDNTFDITSKRIYVGTFIPGSSKFLFVNLQDEQLQFQGINLDINFKIPQLSKSGADSDGNYYLGGGIQNGKVSENFYLLLFNQRSLNRLSPMSAPRAKHAMKYIKKLKSFIVVGGISDLETFKPQKSSEIYNISSNTWTPSAKMNFVAIDCTLIERDDFIYKVGGKVDEFTSSNYIERYDINAGTWEIFGYDTISIDQAFLRMPNRSGGLSSGSSIILFGGMVHKVRSNATYKIDVSKAKPTLEEWKPTPLAGSIISPVIKYKGEYYAIQDIALDIETEAEDFTKKKLIILSDDNWEIVL